jgi:hypothetical protein
MTLRAGGMVGGSAASRGISPVDDDVVPYFMP